MQICGIFSAMVVPFCSTALWGYHCQPFWQKTVLGTYYAVAFVCAISATFAKSSIARCRSLHLVWIRQPCFGRVPGTRTGVGV